MRVLLLLSAIVLSFAACKNCDGYVDGYIVNKSSREVIPNAKIRSVGAMNGREKDERIVYSDSTGYFQTRYSSKGTAKCPVFKLEISAEGFRTEYVTTFQVGDTFLMNLTD